MPPRYYLKSASMELSMVLCACNPGSQEVEVGGFCELRTSLSCRVKFQGECGLERDSASGKQGSVDSSCRLLPSPASRHSANYHLVELKGTTYFCNSQI